MSFDLMQAEIIAKFVWLGQKLGISSQNEGEENDDKHDTIQQSFTDFSNKETVIEKNNDKCQENSVIEKAQSSLTKLSILKEKKSPFNRADQSVTQNLSSNEIQIDPLRQIRLAYLQNVYQRR